MATMDTDRSETEVAIMEATYRALCEHGYADLTIQKIADEFEKSKSLLYYHYDSKDALLVEFLEFALERFAADFAVGGTDDPEGRLRDLIDRLVPESIDDADDEQFQVAVFELRSNAPFDDAYHEQFTKADAIIRTRIAELVEAGTEDGVFRDVDPDRTASMLVAVISGAMVERVTTDDTVEAIRGGIEDYVENHLLVEGSR